MQAVQLPTSTSIVRSLSLLKYTIEEEKNQPNCFCFLFFNQIGFLACVNPEYQELLQTALCCKAEVSGWKAINQSQSTDVLVLAGSGYFQWGMCSLVYCSPHHSLKYSTWPTHVQGTWISKLQYKECLVTRKRKFSFPDIKSIWVIIILKMCWVLTLHEIWDGVLYKQYAGHENMPTGFEILAPHPRWGAAGKLRQACSSDRHLWTPQPPGCAQKLHPTSLPHPESGSHCSLISCT